MIMDAEETKEPEEAIETGMMLMAGAEESMEKDFDA